MDPGDLETHLYDHLAGVLLGTAVGDALGLYMEGLSAKSIAAWFPSGISRYYLLGNTGFVSDDTEQSALLAQALIRSPDDCGKCTRAFKTAMLGWFCRMPFGVGRATCFACLRMLVGARETGIHSAGNGAAMRSAIIGVYFFDDPEKRIQFGTCLARATHIDARAIDGALFVAEMAAALFVNRQNLYEEARYSCFETAIQVVNENSLRAALLQAQALASAKTTLAEAGQRIGSSGFVNQSVPLAAFVFLRFGGEIQNALQSAIQAGGDTDTNAAIVGAWCGAFYGEKKLPHQLVYRINNGPFGPRHLRALAKALVGRGSAMAVVPPYSWPLAFARNVILIPIILSHTFLRVCRSA